MAILNAETGFELYFLQGEVESEPGPGVEGYFDGPYYSYYKWHQRDDDEEHERSVEDAFSLIEETVEEDGPFDAILGFSHGGATAYKYLAQHAKDHPLEPAFHSAIFLNAFPPSRYDDDAQLHYDDLGGSILRIPTMHVIGKRDFVRSHSRALWDMTEKSTSIVIEHEMGHEIPRDVEITARICKLIKNLCQRGAF